MVSSLELAQIEQPLPTATSNIGIEVGIARFATLSDKTFIAPLNSSRKHQRRMRRKVSSATTG